jgi:hypothetical protein
LISIAGAMDSFLQSTSSSQQRRQSHDEAWERQLTPLHLS